MLQLQSRLRTCSGSRVCLAAERILRNFKMASMQISDFQGPITSQITYGHLKIRGLGGVRGGPYSQRTLFNLSHDVTGSPDYRSLLKLN